MMRKFASGFSHDMVLECKSSLLNKDLDISRMTVYMQQVEDEMKKQAQIGERLSKKFWY